MLLRHYVEKGDLIKSFLNNLEIINLFDTFQN